MSDGSDSSGLCWREATSLKCCECLRCCGRRDPRPRSVWLGHPEKREQRYPRNVINNQKYNFFTFLPGVLFNQFKYFFNLYFLLLACSQFVVEMRLGALYTYWVPLGFVLAVTVIREAAEELRCYMRDKEEDSDPPVNESLSIENTLWASTVIASGKVETHPAESALHLRSVFMGKTSVCAGTVVGVVLYTGRELRSVMNTSNPRSKIGLFDLEVNCLTKILFGALVVVSLVMVALQHFAGRWYLQIIRFLLLFSNIIPISLRVNLDMGKIVYSWVIRRDSKIPGTVVRSSTIPEQLGRISYLLTDKTGTLTQNEMVFKRLHLGTVAYGLDSMDEVQSHIFSIYTQSVLCVPQQAQDPPAVKGLSLATKVRRSMSSRVHEAVKAIALCHNVTPVYESNGVTDQAEAERHYEDSCRVYQASSPDEVSHNVPVTPLAAKTPWFLGQRLRVALVQWTESVGLTLVGRDQSSVQLRSPGGHILNFTILQIFPFTYESKRMGIIVRCGNMAREGLRVLVVAKKSLTEEQYQDFEARYVQAKLSVHDRSLKVATVIESLEMEMELLCLTGVEDQLQTDVWMLTGDKLETATCTAKNAHLVTRTQDIHIFRLVCLKYYECEFMELACQCPAVVCCRCAPTQKAQIVRLLQERTGKLTCAVVLFVLCPAGDGGNDVSMIQEADCGVGVEGKEGKQASLAADFSITQFKHLGRLLMVHGRNSYKRSAALSQFVIHRSLCISTMQAVFSSVFYFASVPLYQGFLIIGYSTIYTMFPVFSLVLDKDVKSEVAMLYPELYKDLLKFHSLAGSIIMYGALLLFESEFVHIVAISFTSLILTELLMVALTIQTWHWLMIVAELLSLSCYIASLVFLHEFIGEVSRSPPLNVYFIATLSFLWKVTVITLVSCLPLYVLKYLRRRFSPPSYSKLTS
ncbi:hypothetical protein EK904_006693 [Melospiza melodia maxima]|nr:hypothetical protein EK904_006693 [Melospiza melodia maxima]